MSDETQLPARAQAGIELSRTAVALFMEDRYEETGRGFADALRAFHDAAPLLSAGEYAVYAGMTEGRLAVARELLGDRAAARALYEQALGRLGPFSAGAPAMEAEIHVNFGDYLRDEGDLGAARDHLEAAVAALERERDDEHGLRARANALQKLGMVLLDQGDLQRAYDALALASAITSSSAMRAP